MRKTSRNVWSENQGLCIMSNAREVKVANEETNEAEITASKPTEEYLESEEKHLAWKQQILICWKQSWLLKIQSQVKELSLPRLREIPWLNAWQRPLSRVTCKWPACLFQKKILLR